MQRTSVLAAGLVAAGGLASLAGAGLLGILPDFPQLAFDNQGVTSYSAGGTLFSVAASPLAIRFAPATTPVIVTGPDSLTISIVIDNDGMLLGGVAGSDLVVQGSVNAPGGPLAGTLLTGEISEFGFLDSGGTTDVYDFRFTVTGGLLADDYFMNQDIGLVLTSEQSSFAGSFAVDFAGEAKGTLGSIPLGAKQGCTPGYWKQPHHFDSWCIYEPTDLFTSVFRVSLPDRRMNPTLAEALRLKGGHINALMRHAVAALLNAACPDVSPDPALDTPLEVIALVQAAILSGDYETAKAILEASNEENCPLD